ncbi:MAG: hypothetical protein ACRCZF_27255 [Gemmataceae bacterium]
MTTHEILTPAQLAEIRALIEQTGFLPTTNKATRLFAAARRVHPDPAELDRLEAMFLEAGYLPRSKALRLVDLVMASV